MKKHTSKNNIGQSENTQKKVKGFQLKESKSTTSKFIRCREDSIGRKMHGFSDCVASLNQ